MSFLHVQPALGYPQLTDTTALSRASCTAELTETLLGGGNHSLPPSLQPDMAHPPRCAMYHIST